MEDTINIVEYDQSWAEAFESEKEALLSGLGAEAVAIEHVGSTAIPGQASKPVIDIFVGLTPLRPVAYYESRFDPASYTHIPTGMQGRYLFAKRTEGKWTHNVHLMMYDALFPTRNEILLRDYLRRHPELVTQYGAVKRAAALNASSMEAYTKEKTAFIQMVVDAARSELGLPLQNVWED
ncbi:GrpB family protein [Paenibacillus sp. p3-SID867]|uniref:GrpB family protein n=1 Tax=Paenibacillus sp. p3-SID867 TaxID=2916363 RepID=UPI0021A3848B|nr:GrpB family protein [Paenibacillus sp. p3-SID867]MCT1400611.1 GrpB family protein [Paenibacillus sp. p3-SID867]